MSGEVLVRIVNIVFNLAAVTILVQVILSWVLNGRLINSSHSLFPLLVQLYNILREITEPILQPIRRFATVGMMDFSPVVALILISVIRGLLVQLLTRGF